MKRTARDRIRGFLDRPLSVEDLTNYIKLHFPESGHAVVDVSYVLKGSSGGVVYLADRVYEFLGRIAVEENCEYDSKSQAERESLHNCLTNLRIGMGERFTLALTETGQRRARVVIDEKR